MDNIFYLADNEGITAFKLDTNILKAWIKDVIKQNDLKAIVLVWDEFSDYFKNNKNTLSDFQNLVTLCQEAPFYFVIVTHITDYIINDVNPDWKKVIDRFVRTEIELPDNIAFDLIKDALKKKKAAENDWNSISGNLFSSITDAASEVTKAVKLKDVDELKGIIPIHPYSAMLLKNIASAFASNQRSMFEFIKTKNSDECKSFQWYIENHRPIDDRPLLTIDLLWDFFYEKGKANLTPDIRAILDTYPRQQKLDGKESAVLKTILMMQAIDQRTGGALEIFKTTDKNVKLAFEGIPGMEGGTVISIAKKLAHQDKILYEKPLADGVKIFAAAAILGDEADIENKKNDLRETLKTQEIVSHGEIANVIFLPPPLKLRYEITPVTIDNFTRTINGLREKCENQQEIWKFYAVIALAKNEDESLFLQKKIKEDCVNKDYEKILFIDALCEPLNENDLETYLDFRARADYWMQKDGKLGEENSRRAKEILDKWKERIASNRFIVHSHINQEGENCPNSRSVLESLKLNVTRRFKDVFEFSQRTINGATKNITESQLNINSLKSGVLYGIKQQTSGALGGIELILLPSVWKVDNYWDANTSISISRIKIRIDGVINSAFEKDNQIFIGEIYDLLVTEFGFAPCNMYAFLAGFLLKEYAQPPYRFADESGANEPMSPDKLAEMISNYIKQCTDAPNRRYSPTYIQKLRPEEKAFFELSEKVFKIPQNQCSSPEDVARILPAKIKEYEYPLWCLAEIDGYGVFDIVKKYLELLQKEGKDASVLVNDIGKAVLSMTNLADNMCALVTHNNCVKGMDEFLSAFENGEIKSLAKEINAVYLADVRKIFDVKYSCRWDKESGQDEIRNLIVEYNVIRETNIILRESANSIDKFFAAWEEHLRFIKISHEVTEFPPDLNKAFVDIAQKEKFLPDRLRVFLDLLKKHSEQIKNFFELQTQTEIFTKVYAGYLGGLNENDIKKIISELPYGLFIRAKQDCNIIVNEKAEEAKRNQLKTKLKAIWREKTDSKDPRDWSNHHRTPALCLVPDKYFHEAKAVFYTLNHNNPAEKEVAAAITFLENAAFLDDFNNPQKRDEAFLHSIIGKFAAMLPSADEVRNYLETKITAEAQEWYENPNVKRVIEEYAKSRYDAGGSDKALQTIEGMDSAKLKDYLKSLVKENMAVGIEIIINEGKQHG